MYDLATLSAREEIKELKARYFRFADLHDFEGFGGLFTDDAIMESGKAGGPIGVAASGRAAIIELAKAASKGFIKVHHGHNGEITIHDPANASGIWSGEYSFFEDAPPNRCAMHTYAHYHDTFIKSGGVWLFSKVRIITIHALVRPD